ncbi:MAG: acetolactate synthase small subunit [Myxococcales bacterium]|nr:MAG: acetolactate synthase small subunit [Myxococcales bacterium]
MTQKESRTFVVYVEDKPGVLNRVASLFRRRAYNIVSLNVGRTHEPGVSRMTIVVESDSDMAQRFSANLYKMVNVLSVEDITETPSVTRHLALIKLVMKPEKRAQALEICNVFRAHVVDIAPEALIVEITGALEKIEGFVTVLQPFGVAEIVQTGAISMKRGAEISVPKLNLGKIRAA